MASVLDGTDYVQFEVELNRLIQEGRIPASEAPKLRQEFAEDRIARARMEDKRNIANMQPVPGIYSPGQSVSGIAAQQVAQNPAPKPTWVPDWGWDVRSQRVNAIGMLYLRLTWNGHGGYDLNYGKFTVENITFIDAVTSRGIVYIFTMVDGDKPLVLQDEASLFPSDSLLVKLRALKD